MKAQVFAVLCLAIVVASQSCATAPFGAATGFNLFVLSSSQTLDGCNSDVEGAVAGAGPVNLINYSVGLKTPATFPYDYTLVSAGPITFENGAVIGGGIIGSSVDSISKVEIRPNDGEGSVFYASCCQENDCYACTAGPSFINFNEARSFLNALSDTFTTYDTTPDAQIVVRYGSVDLYCGSDAFNVFTGVSIDNTLTQLQIHCSASQTVLINYTPGTTGYPAGFSVNLLDGITAGTVVHHFTNLFLSFSSEIEGTVFAPRSCLSFPNGLITGDVIVDIFDTPGSCNGVQINSAPFCGCIPVPPTTNYCCSYSRDTSTRTICSTLPCSYQSIPQWTFEGQAETDDCDDCCYLAAN